MSIANPPATIAMQGLLANRIRRATRQAAATLAFVPADKLDYKPSDTSNSCRELAQHIVEGNGYCLGAIGLIGDTNPSATEIEGLIAAISSTGEQLAGFAETASDETLAGSVEFFGRSFALPEFLLTAEWHISRHTAQIDYLETTWGDLEDHF